MQDEVMDRSRGRVAVHDQSLHVGITRFATKPSGYLVEPQNQDRRLGGRRRDAGGHVAESQGLCREDVVCGNGVAIR
jgi:hypothetical protein